MNQSPSKQSCSDSQSLVPARLSFPVFVLAMLLSQSPVFARENELMVRISEIQIDRSSSEEYKAILKEEAEASVRLEPGVIAIFPMYQKENPAEFRVLEIYASREAYQAHLKTPHFERYKTTTLKMVKSLRLVDMETLDAKTMLRIFVKTKGAR